MYDVGSKMVAAAAIRMALTASRADEGDLKKDLMEKHNIKGVAVD